MTHYKHWKDVPKAKWPWKGFSPEEMACRAPDDALGRGELLVVPDAMDKLQALRDALGKPMIVNSAYRTPVYNKTLPGSAKDSLHTKGMAFDISMANHDPAVFEDKARNAGFTGFGFYPKENFMHIDTGPARVWGKRWPVGTPKFKAEAIPEKPKVAAPVTVGALGGAFAIKPISDALDAVAPALPIAQSIADAKPYLFIGVVAVAGLWWLAQTALKRRNAP